VSRPSRRRAVALATCLTLLAFAAAVPATARSAPTPLRGAATHLWTSYDPATLTRELDALDAAGANAVRFDVSWATLEEQGNGVVNQWYLGLLRDFIDKAAARDIKVIASLIGTPCWASTAPDTLKDGCSAGWFDRGVGWYPPASMAEYGDAARYVTSTFGSRLAALEVWNEPNLCVSKDPVVDCAEKPGSSGRFWRTDRPGTTDNLEAVRYAELLKAAYPAAKQGDATVPVLAGAMAWGDGGFLRSLYAQGIKGH